MTNLSEQIALEFWFNRIKMLSAVGGGARSTKATQQSFSIDLDGPLYDRLKKVSLDNAGSECVLGISAYNVLLYKYNLGDALLATPAVSVERGISNDCLLFFQYGCKGTNFQQNLAAFQHQFKDAVQHNRYDFRQLIQTVEINTPFAEGDLLQFAFAYNKIHGYDTSVLSRFNFALSVYDTGTAWQLRVDYKADVFDAVYVRQMLFDFIRTLDFLLNHITAKVSDFSILDDEVKRQLVVDFNNRLFHADGACNILPLFKENVKAHGAATAILAGDRKISYRELDMLSDAIAHQLKIGQGDVVAMVLQPSVEAVVGILAVLKSGGIYVPIDPDYPEERIAFILEDCGAGIIVSAQSVLDDRPKLLSRREVVLISTDTIAVAMPFDVAVGDDAIAYAIYTSGTTGHPKGVMISHRSLYNYCTWAKRTYLSAGATGFRFAFYTSLAFDLTITSIFTPLVSGGTIVVFDVSLHENLVEAVFRSGVVDVVKATPSHLKLMRGVKVPLNTVRCIIAGGENLETSLAFALSEDLGGEVSIYNEYGPTEATVGCMIYRYRPSDDSGLYVPIGVPIDNTAIYLLDSDLNPVPMGAVGEMYIAGVGVAAGYLNRPALTAERFIPNPYGAGFLYKTGDQARMLPDCNIAFIGRTDGQVKLNGYRIELAEIEAALAAIPGVNQVVVDIVDRDESPGGALRYCVKCGLPSNYPDVVYNEQGICNTCIAFDSYKDKATDYFKSLDELTAIFESNRSVKTSEFDCVMLLSGGKDSTYVLYQLVVEFRLNVLVLSFDNGFISEGAKENIRRVAASLNVELIFGTTPYMNQIFADSLARHSNVCNGCFKTIYTLGISLARERGIRFIVTGLSRGQIFETRLNELYSANVFDVETIDRTILDARKTYHRLDDGVRQYMDTAIFDDDTLFEEIQIVDFFRYSDVTLEGIYGYLSKHAPWVRPSDTGRSTNCLINELGIYIHKKERGYHNYALPYAWDVRMGHKTREEALEELDDEIQVPAVRRMLQEVGYAEDAKVSFSAQRTLASWYVSDSGVRPEAIRQQLAARLPGYMVPSVFFSLPQLPLTLHGKVNRRALPGADDMRTLAGEDYTAPRTETEVLVADIWERVLKRGKVGIHDSFLMIGGDSINAIQISARLYEQGYKLSVKDIISKPTIAEQAQVLVKSQGVSDQAPVVGEVAMGPIQHAFFSWETDNLNHFNQSVLLRISETVNVDLLQAIFTTLAMHHDALRSRFVQVGGTWRQEVLAAFPGIRIAETDLREDFTNDRFSTIAGELQASLDIGEGRLMAGGLFHLKDADRFLLVIHHLVVDGVSWRILLQDFSKLYQQYRAGVPLVLPLKTDPANSWYRYLSGFARTPAFIKEVTDYWLPVVSQDVIPIPRDFDTETAMVAGSEVLTFDLDVQSTLLLQGDIHHVYDTQVEDILLAGLVVAIRSVFGNIVTRLALEGHGRETEHTDVNLTRTVGWFTSLYPVILTCPDGDLPETVRAVRKTMQAVPSRGIGFGIAKYLSDYGHATDFDFNVGAPQVVFNYHGVMHSISAEHAQFRVLPDEAGDVRSAGMVRLYDLEVSGIINDARLTVSIDFHPSQYSPERIEALLDAYRSALQDITVRLVHVREFGLPVDQLSYRKLRPEVVRELALRFDIADILPLTPMQEGMLLFHLVNRDSRAYFQQIAYRIKGPLVIAVVQRVVDFLTDRHDILRTAFVYENTSEAVQVVLRGRRAAFSYYDVRDVNPADREEQVRQFRLSDQSRGFDLTEGALMRVAIFQIEDGLCEFIWSYHHIILDGWSASILIAEFFRLYQSFLANQEVVLPAVSYSRYVAWLQKQDSDGARTYWKQYLAGYGTVASMQTRSVARVAAYTPGRKNFALGMERSAALQKLAARCGSTVSTVLQVLWGILLAKYNNTRDVVFGMVTSGRSPEIAGIENMVGLFINTIPVRVVYVPGETFGGLVKHVQQANAVQGAHQFLSLTEIQAQTVLRQGLFDHIIVFENYPLGESLTAAAVGGLEVTGFTVTEQTPYALNVIVRFDAGVQFTFDYNGEVFEDVAIENMMRHLMYLVDQAILQADAMVDELVLIPREAQQAIFTSDRKIEIESVSDTLHGVFESITQQYPDAVALRFENRSVTYGCLDVMTNRLGRYLRDRYAIGPNDLVGIMADRSEWLIVAMLGILKAGGGYVPIDRRYPEDRIAFMVQDSGVRVIITDALPGDTVAGCDTLLFDSFLADMGEVSGDALPSVNTGMDTAYVIYTSGSTGKPKGVVVLHRNVISLLFHRGFPFSFGPSDTWTMFHSECFDFSVWEIFGALLYGGKVVVAARESVLDPNTYLTLIERERVTVLNYTPTVFNKLLSVLQAKSERPALSVRYVVFGGEALKPATLGWWMDTYPDVKLINMYGITETCVHVTFKQITRKEVAHGVSNIGRPLDSLFIYIVDDAFNLVPDGIPGEIIVGGEGVAAGYLNREALTAERFVQNKFNPTQRLYRSGDLGMRLADGDYVYLGRKDNQVKVRGFRIEMGEIQFALLKYPAVRQAEVVVDHDREGNALLKAYYVSDMPLGASALRSHLGASLPEYMVPSFFVHLSEFPSTVNGKLDVSALPSVEAGRDDAVFSAATTDVERQLIAIWKRILGADNIGIEDNFFEIGGDSLKVISVINAVNQVFDNRLKVSDLYNYGTIAALSRIVDAKANTESSQVKQFEEFEL